MAVLWNPNISWQSKSVELGSYDLAWHHYALVRKGNLVSAYQDGALKGTMTFEYAVADPGQYVVIGGNAMQDNSRTINGYIDDLRILKGYALYQAAFTPPTSALTNISRYICYKNGYPNYDLNSQGSGTCSGDGKVYTLGVAQP